MLDQPAGNTRLARWVGGLGCLLYPIGLGFVILAAWGISRLV